MPGSPRERRIAAIVIAFAGLVALGIFLPMIGPLAKTDKPVLLNQLQIDFHQCPADLPVGAGLNALRSCGGIRNEVDVRLTSDGADVSASTVDNRFSTFRLPMGPLRLHVDGVAEGTVDVLSCRTYVQDDEGADVVLSVVPQIAYGTDPMTASIITQPLLMANWPANRWVANAVDPPKDRLEEDKPLYAESIRCEWFLLAPGTVTERPGVVRTYTTTDSAGEPMIHVLGPGGPVDGSAPNVESSPLRPVDTFDFRSTTNGTGATTGDSWIDHYLMPAGTWVVTDRTTGHQATVDIAPGQTTRVVSVTAIVAPNPATPGAPGPIPTLIPPPRR